MYSKSKKINERINKVKELFEKNPLKIDEIDLLVKEFKCSKNTIRNDVLLISAEWDNNSLKDIIHMKWKGFSKRAFIYGVKNDLSYKELEELVLNSKGVCKYCGRKFKNLALLTGDHIKPLSKGGENTLNNIVISCTECNNKKGACLHFSTQHKIEL